MTIRDSILTPNICHYLICHVMYVRILFKHPTSRTLKCFVLLFFLSFCSMLTQWVVFVVCGGGGGGGGEGGGVGDRGLV